MRFGNEENWVNGMNFFFLWKCFMNFYDTYRLSARVDFCWCWMSNCFPVCILMYGIELSFLLVLSFCRWKYLYLSVCSSCPYPFVFVNLSIFSCVTSHVCRLSLLCCNISSNPFLSKADQKPVMNGITGSISCSFQTFRNLKINLICERNVLFVISQYWLNCYKEMYIECSFIINTILIVILPVELSSISLLP